jgi:hypothetical protein
VFEAIDADGTGNLSCSEITEFAQGLPSMLLERHRNLAFTGQHDNTPYAGDTLVGNAQILQVHTTRLRWTIPATPQNVAFPHETSLVLAQDGTLRLDASRNVKVESVGGYFALDARRNLVGSRLFKQYFNLIARALTVEPTIRHKDVYVAAREAIEPEGKHVLLPKKGEKAEDSDDADKVLVKCGDWIVTALAPNTLKPITDEVWVVIADQFTSLYAPCGDRWIEDDSAAESEEEGEESEPDTPQMSSEAAQHMQLLESAPLLAAEAPPAPTKEKGKKRMRGPGQLFLGKNKISTIEFRGGILVATPWGGDQNLWRQPSYLFYSHVTEEVYACERERCHATYTVHTGKDSTRRKLALGQTMSSLSSTASTKPESKNGPTQTLSGTEAGADSSSPKPADSVRSWLESANSSFKDSVRRASHRLAAGSGLQKVLPNGAIEEPSGSPVAQSASSASTEAEKNGRQ